MRTIKLGFLRNETVSVLIISGICKNESKFHNHVDLGRFSGKLLLSKRLRLIRAPVEQFAFLEILNIKTTFMLKYTNGLT